MVIQAAGRQVEITLTDDLPLRVIQPLYRQTYVIAAQGAGLVVQIAARFDRQPPPASRLPPALFTAPSAWRSRPASGFYRAALIIEAAGIEAKSPVATHRATAIVDQVTHSPVLRRITQRHQAATLIDQLAGRKQKALRLDGAITVIQLARQREAILTITSL